MFWCENHDNEPHWESRTSKETQICCSCRRETDIAALVHIFAASQGGTGRLDRSRFQSALGRVFASLQPLVPQPDATWLPGGKSVFFADGQHTLRATVASWQLCLSPFAYT